MGALLALGGGACWGVGDFLGGVASRRAPVIAVLALSQTIGLAGLVAWVALSGRSFPGAMELVPAVGAGAVGVIGMGALYRGLAVGAMGIVAPISAASPMVPLALDVGKGDVPSPLQWLGIVLVLGGIAVVSQHTTTDRRRAVASGTGLAITAALGFGLYIVGIDAAAHEDPIWAVVVARSAAVFLVAMAALVARTAIRPSGAPVPMLVIVGLVDAGANVLVATATTLGTAGIVAVLSSIYPVVTIGLATVLLGERLSAAKRAAGAVALVGAALVTAG